MSDRLVSDEEIKKIAEEMGKHKPVNIPDGMNGYRNPMYTGSYNPENPLPRMVETMMQERRN